MYAGRGRYPQWRAIVTREILNGAVIWGLFCVVATWLNVLHIANAAHGGGFLFGLAVGWLFIRRQHRIASALAILGLLALTVLSVTWMPWSPCTPEPGRRNSTWGTFPTCQYPTRCAVQQSLERASGHVENVPHVVCATAKS